MEKPGHGREAAHAAKSAIRLSLPYRGGDGVKTMTADNSSRFPAHGKITETMKETTVCFADPYLRGKKVKVQAKINARPREKLKFSTPKREFFKHSSNFALVG